MPNDPFNRNKSFAALPNDHLIRKILNQTWQREEHYLTLSLSLSLPLTPSLLLYKSLSLSPFVYFFLTPSFVHISLSLSPLYLSVYLTLSFCIYLTLSFCINLSHSLLCIYLSTLSFCIYLSILSFCIYLSHSFLLYLSTSLSPFVSIYLLFLFSPLSPFSHNIPLTLSLVFLRLSISSFTLTLSLPLPHTQMNILKLSLKKIEMYFY